MFILHEIKSFLQHNCFRVEDCLGAIFAIYYHRNECFVYLHLLSSSININIIYTEYRNLHEFCDKSFLLLSNTGSGQNPKKKYYQVDAHQGQIRPYALDSRDCLRSKLIQTFQLDINLDLWDFFLEYYNCVFSFLRLTSRFSFPVPFVFSELSGGNAHGTSKHFSEQIFERMRPGRNFFAWNWKTCTQFFSTLQCKPCHTLFRFWMENNRKKSFGKKCTWWPVEVIVWIFPHLSQ